MSTKNYRDCPVRLNTNHRHGKQDLQIKYWERLVGSDEPLRLQGFDPLLVKAMDDELPKWDVMASISKPLSINPLINNG